MDSLVEFTESFFPPQPWAYSWELRLFQWFPAATVFQWLLDYHPTGKFSLPNSALNLNGRFSWCVMEVVGPINMLYIFATLPAKFGFTFLDLPLWNKVAGALYVVHYFNRSILNPLFVAPSISPVRLEIFLFAFIFNLFNSSCLAGWIVGYDFTPSLGYLPSPASSMSLQQILPYIGLVTFAYGMIGNIRAERTLWRLRREEAHRRASKKSDQDVATAAVTDDNKKNIYHKVYIIPPPKGLFRWVLHPHYSLEWLEWFGFVLVGTAVYPAASRMSQNIPPTSLMTPAPWLYPFSVLAEWLHVPFPWPALVFVMNDVFTMLPQARRGLRWYTAKFGKDEVAGRSAVIPGISFLVQSHNTGIMTFLKGHLQRKTSDRKQAFSLDTTVQHRQSESSSSKSASLSNTEKKKKKGSIEIEVENLFRQAADASSAPGRSHNHGPTKVEPSLFLRFMKRREHPTTSIAPANGLKRAFSHRHHAPATPIVGNAGDDKVVHSSTPDLVREGSYDSDALFICSPRFSTQSWESLHASSPLRMNITNVTLPDEKKYETTPKADGEILLPPTSECQHSSHALSVPKRRGQPEIPIERSDCSRSLCGSDVTNNNECVVTRNGYTAAGSLQKQSRFTEMFHHVGLGAISSAPSLRKVSIGWMSEGKRCGYGYSFVDSDETARTSCESGVFTDGSSETTAKEETNKDLDTRDGQDTTIAVNPPIDGETHQNEEHKGSSLEIETINTSNESSQWASISSHSRTDRNDSANIEDGIIVRDFCTKASPDRPQHEENNLEEKRHLMANAVRQGFLDTFLWMIGLGKREIARYHAGLDVQAARSHDCCQDSMFEMTIPYWDYAPKEELGNYHIEAWKAAKRRSREQRRARPTTAATTGAPGVLSNAQESSFLSSGGGEKYVGRRHSLTF
ncbi:hypothetical protein UA08_05658 [Talaromyces atroroseus]|uniref:Uncharacterized protein n=1 Tax=Talaromyces atroroseus TaxID=1441469 RepID=A0A225B076_TALAT|nr:hypothetical protein UA08_05658 [Talaromyces atroroseus]OKL59187.1 hypothetical protein UA08_05658 [Talaromyces atroroseus]